MEETLSVERKRLQTEGLLPEWMTTASWQIVKKKYLSKGESYRDRLNTISGVLSKHTDNPTHFKVVFFNLMWKGWLSPSTPVLANTGTTKGYTVSCAGSYFGDSINEIYSSKHETAMLSKAGFGTSGDLSDIRPRGALIQNSFKSTGVAPIIRGLVNDCQYVAQGAQRRGAFASYLDIEHGDFYEVCNMLIHEPDDLNIGWVIRDSFIQRLDSGDKEAVDRFQTAMQAKLTTGKGYFWLRDKAQRHLPQVYKDCGLEHRASQLCSEIVLISDEEHTYTCVLSSMNLAKYDEWKDTDAIYNSTIFLDCVCSEFISQAEGQPGMEKAIRFTKKFRALGLGVMGFHTYLQDNNISWGSLEAVYFNLEVFKRLQEESLRASKDLGPLSQEMASTGRRNGSLVAIAPTMSTALILGGISQGIEPISANVYTQSTSAGEVYRINPSFLNLLKSKGKYNQEVLKSVEENKGSVQQLNFLTDEEKLVFRTGFEVDQEVILRLASQRQEYIDQGQSLNLFFDSEVSESEVARIHEIAFKDKNLLGLYYLRTKRGVAIKSTCEACEN